MPTKYQQGIKALLEELDRFHRLQLEAVLRVLYPEFESVQEAIEFFSEQSEAPGVNPGLRLP